MDRETKEAARMNTTNYEIKRFFIDLQYSMYRT